MRVKWVLIGFGILYLLFVLSFLPAEKVFPRPVEEVWEIITGLLWAMMTVVSIGLLQAMSPLATPFAAAGGFSRGLVAEIMLAVVLVVVAAYSAVCLRRRDLTPGRRGTYTFCLLLALTLVAMVRFTLYSWSHFA